MSQLSAWLSMGGYAVYVWPAYVLVSSVLILGAISVKKQAAQTRKKLLQWVKDNTP